MRRVQFSSLIVTGQMTREEALEKLKTPAYDPVTIKHDFEYIATKLGISVEELRGYHEAPNKTYRDYKSQQAIYTLGAPLMRNVWKCRASASECRDLGEHPDIDSIETNGNTWSLIHSIQYPVNISNASCLIDNASRIGRPSKWVLY